MDAVLAPVRMVVWFAQLCLMFGPWGVIVGLLLTTWFVCSIKS